VAPIWQPVSGPFYCPQALALRKPQRLIAPRGSAVPPAVSRFRRGPPGSKVLLHEFGLLDRRTPSWSPTGSVGSGRRVAVAIRISDRVSPLTPESNALAACFAPSRSPARRRRSRSWRRGRVLCGCNGSPFAVGEVGVPGRKPGGSARWRCRTCRRSHGALGRGR